ncbi:MAG: pitrilysin family protein [Pseudomonadota bacterium]
MTPDITVLPSGLTVTSVTLPRVETVSLGVYVGVGARFEEDVPGGISHFLEHMVFKGSHRRSARQLAEAVEDVGGAINAYTARDVTAYYLRLLKDDAALGIDILADLLFGARLDDAEVVKERDVILQEIGQVFDTPDDLVFDVLQEVAYPGQAFGAPILGTADTISQIDSAALKAFRQTHYCAGNIVLSAAGNITHEALLDLARTHFNAVPEGQKIMPAPAHWHAGQRILERPSEQVHLTLGYEAPGLEEESIYAVQVLSTMLGGGMSSRLFQEVREERGLAYSVFCDVSAHAGTGLLSIYAGTSPADADQALGLIRETCQAMTAADDLKELARAKAQLKAGLAMSLESSAGISEQMGRQMLAFGRTIPPAELIAKVEAITPADVRAAAQQCFGGDECFARVGPAR